MNPKDAYKYCLRCGHSVVLEKENMLTCPKCNFAFYINPAASNAAIIENDKGEILLVKRKFDPQKGYWDWPGGFLEINENLEESIKREIKEELGVEIELDRFIGVYPDTYLSQGILRPVISLVMSG